MRAKAIVAALSLAVVTAIVTIGTIWSAGEAQAYCHLGAPCPHEAQVVDTRASGDVTPVSNRDWEASAHHFLYQIELGFLRLAGTPSGPY